MLADVGLCLLHSKAVPKLWHSEGFYIINEHEEFDACEGCWRCLSKEQPTLSRFCLANCQFMGRNLESLMGDFSAAESLLCRRAYSSTRRYVLSKKGSRYIGEAGNNISCPVGQMGGFQGNTIFYQLPSVVPAAVGEEGHDQNGNPTRFVLPSSDLQTQIQVQICGPLYDASENNPLVQAEDREKAWKKLPMLTIRVKQFERLIKLLSKTNPCHFGCEVRDDLEDGVPPGMEDCVQLVEEDETQVRHFIGSAKS
jgi:hypothetical protein